MSETIRILIADDHADVREYLRSLIAAEPGIELAGEATDSEAAVRLFDVLLPDVVLLDLLMPPTDGIHAIREIKQRNPQACILVLTSFAEDEKVFPAIKAGAMGYILKGTSAEDLSFVVQDAYQGEPLLDPFLARKVLQEVNRPVQTTPTTTPLTADEREVLEQIARGGSRQEIAEMLAVSEVSVKDAAVRILTKLQLAQRSGTALYALRGGRNPEIRTNNS